MLIKKKCTYCIYSLRKKQQQKKKKKVSLNNTTDLARELQSSRNSRPVSVEPVIIFTSFIKLKKIKDLHWDFKTINFQEFRKAKELFMSEKYDDPTYYDYDYNYYVEENPEYKKNWTRFTQINTEHWREDFISLNDRYIDSEKKENKEKYKKPKKIIRKKKN